MDCFGQGSSLSYSGPLKKLKKWITDRKKPTISDQKETADIALLAVGPISKTKRVNLLSGDDESRDQLLAKILSDRRPAWIDDWIAEKLKGDWKQINWCTLRTLIKSGVCQKPSSEGYIELMASSMPGPWHANKGPMVPLSEKLLAEPELLREDVWRLFEVETIAFKFDYYYDRRSSSKYETWPLALKRLADEGHLDRNRLVDACLSGLSTGFKNNVLSGYATPAKALILNEKAWP